MAVTVSGTGITFNDATTQTTAFTGAGGVTSAVAGNGVAVSGATGAVTFSASCPTAYSVGSYTTGGLTSSGVSPSAVNNSNYSNAKQYWIQDTYQGVTDSLVLTVGGGIGNAPVALSGTWKWMSQSTGSQSFSIMGLMCRVS